MCIESPEGLLKHRLLSPTPPVVGLRICISNKFQLLPLLVQGPHFANHHPRASSFPTEASASSQEPGDERGQKSVTVAALQESLRNRVILWAQEEDKIALSMPQSERAAQILIALLSAWKARFQNACVEQVDQDLPLLTTAPGPFKKAERTFVELLIERLTGPTM